MKNKMPIPFKILGFWLICVGQMMLGLWFLGVKPGAGLTFAKHLLGICLLISVWGTIRGLYRVLLEDIRRHNPRASKEEMGK